MNGITNNRRDTRDRRFPGRRSRLRHALLAIAFALPLLFAGCGDDDNPSDPDDGSGDSTGIGRGTIDSLLSFYYPEAITTLDSAGVARMLDERYTFEKLRAPCLNAEDRICDRDEMLRVIGRMFRGRQNPDGVSIESMTLNMLRVNTTPSSDPDQPGDEEWFDVVTIVDMTVVLDDPGALDGAGIRNLLVDSEQEFVVAEDGNSPGDWVIVKQKDRPRINRGVGPGPPATEETSWSELLTLFQSFDRDVPRGSIASLLTTGFPNVYSLGDCVGYDLVLDDRYTFQRLPRDPDDPIEDLFWDKTEEMRIAGRMFGGIPNAAGQSVESIALSINIGSVTPSFASDEPPDEEWFDVVAIIDMTVVVNDPHQAGGDDILNLLVASEQKFIVAADPDSPNDWVIVKQEDQGPVFRVADSFATEESSWGGVKDLFR